MVTMLATLQGVSGGQDGNSSTVGLVIGTDIVVWFVQELVGRIIPSALNDGRFWALIDAGVVPILAAPGIVLAACICAWRHRVGDRETRCRKCGYILKGISEPRCSECGERI